VCRWQERRMFRVFIYLFQSHCHSTDDILTSLGTISIEICLEMLSDDDQIASMSVHSNSLQSKTLTTVGHVIDRSTTGCQLVCRDEIFFENDLKCCQMIIKLHQCQFIQTVYSLKHWPLLVMSLTGLVIISLTGLQLAISWSVAKDFFIENDLKCCQMMIKLHQCQSIQTVYRLKHWPLVIISLTGLRLAISWSVAKDFF